LQAFVAWLPNVRRDARGIFSGHFPSGAHELRRQNPLDAVSIEREIAWAGQLLSQHAVRLSAFVAASTRYEAALVTGRYAECRELLAAIKAEFGTSLWSIETQLALLQLDEGLEAQKAYASGVRDSRSRHDLVSFMAFYISHRNEPTTTPYQFMRQFEDQLNKWEVPDDLKAYLLFRIINRPASDAAAFAAVLRLETSSALVDYYDTFIRLAQQAVTHGDAQLRRVFVLQLQFLAHAIDDPRIHRALFLGTGVVEWIDMSEPGDTSADDAGARGDYRSAVVAAVESIDNDPLDVEMWIAQAEALSQTDLEQVHGSPSLTRESIDHVRNLVEKSDGMDKAVITLLKLGLNHRLQGFAATLDNLVWRELTSDPTSQQPSALIAFLNARRLRPSAMACFPLPEHRLAIASMLAGRCRSSPSFHGHVLQADISEQYEAELLGDCLPEMSVEAKAEFTIGRFLARQDYEKALDIARGAVDTAVTLRRRRLARSIAYCLLKLGRVVEVLSFVVTSCIADAGLIHLLQISQCADRLDKATRKRLAAELSTPVLLDLFARHVDDRLNDIHAYAYEDFLIANGLERPSQLSERLEDFDRDLLVHYLRHICVPSVMQVSSVFGGTRELEDERKAVLSILVKIDPGEAKTYETELREVT
jgi:hypothetical protein